MVSFLKQYFTQLRYLLYKNFLLKGRRWLSTGFEIAFPIYFVIILRLFVNNTPEIPSPSVVIDAPMQGYFTSTEVYLYCSFLRAQNYEGERQQIYGCPAIAWSPNDNVVVNRIMQNFRNLTIPDLPAYSFGGSSEMLTFVAEHPGYIWAAIDFDTGGVTDKITPELDYTIYINQTLLSFAQGNQTGYAQAGLLTLQNYLQLEIVQEVTDSLPSIDLVLMPFPINLDQYNPPSESLGMTLPLSVIFALMQIVTSAQQAVSSDRYSGIKQYMKLVGARGSAYFMSNFVTQSILALVITTLYLGIAYALSIFKYSDFSLLWCLFSLFGINLVLMGFLLSSIFLGQVLSALFGFFFSFLCMAIYGLVHWRLLGDATVVIPKGLLALLSFFSFVPFGRVVDYALYLEKTNQGLNWTMLDHPNMLTVRWTFVSLIVDSILYALLTWYISSVHKDNHGHALPFWFPLSPTYWKNLVFTDKEHDSLPQKNGSDVQIKNLFKVFKRKCCAKTMVTAVDDLSVEFKNGEIFALLGHNGAGKSTTMKVMIGEIVPTSGDVLICNRSVRTEMPIIRKSQMIGYCPQHDFMFPFLTGKEHLKIFAALKGVESKLIKEQTKALIAKLELKEYIKERVSTYSGGMRRKLSVAIALIGDPKIIFLDEPTSGMDPVSRRIVWKVLQEYKERCVIVLTTHSMEEADLLGDRIAIMKNGRMECCGTSNELKNHYGIGYHLYMVKDNYRNSPVSPVDKDKDKDKIIELVESSPMRLPTGGTPLIARRPDSDSSDNSLEGPNSPNLEMDIILSDNDNDNNNNNSRKLRNLQAELSDEEIHIKVEELLSYHFKGYQLLESSSSEIIYQLPLDAVHVFPQFLEELELNLEYFNILSYGLSMTTLEEVFLRVALDDDEKAGLSGIKRATYNLPSVGVVSPTASNNNNNNNSGTIDV